MGRDGLSELTCSSHVERLLGKLPSEQFCEFKRSMKRVNQGPFSYNLLDWLQIESRCQLNRFWLPPADRQRQASHLVKATTVLHGVKKFS